MQKRSWAEFENDPGVLDSMAEENSNDWVTALLAEGYAKEQFDEEMLSHARLARIGSLFDEFSFMLNEEDLVSELPLYAGEELAFETARITHIQGKVDLSIPNPDTLQNEEVIFDLLVWADSDDEIFVYLAQQTLAKGSDKLRRVDIWAACIETDSEDEATVDIDFQSIHETELFKGELKRGQIGPYPKWLDGRGVKFVDETSSDLFSADRRYPVESVDQEMFDQITNLLDHCLVLAESFIEKENDTVEKETAKSGLVSLLRISNN